MIGSRKVLVFGGMALVALGMLYGLYYAVFVEHQTLDQMGGSLAHAFASAAVQNSSQSQAALEAYARTKYDYVRQVDAHSHWIGLGMLLILLGVVFGRVNFSEAIRRVIAISLLAGSAVFPLAVLLQTYHHGALILKMLAVVGPGLVIFGLTGTACGFARRRTS